MTDANGNHCGNCLHKGLDGNYEPCHSCLEGAKKGNVFSGWQPWPGLSDEEYRKMIIEGEQ